MMPTPLAIGMIIGSIFIITGAVVWIIAYFMEYRDEDREKLPGWDEGDTDELSIWRFENRLEEAQRQRVKEKEKFRCPDCNGTRCYQFKVMGEPCGNRHSDEPAEFTGNLLGKHFTFTVNQVPAGYWPLPKTKVGRVRHELWGKVADHCQVSLARPVGAVLP